MDENNIFPELASRNSDGDNYTYANYVAALIEDAVSYDESVLSPARIENEKYYKGELPALTAEMDPVTGDFYEEDINRSTAVSTDVQDTVMAIMPSLMRIFTQSDSVVDIRPNRPDDVEKAQEQTEYINYVFREENDGFLLLHTVFKDALIKRLGIVTWWTEDEEEMRERVFSKVTQEDIMAMVAQWTEGDPEAVVDIVSDPKDMEFDEETGIYEEVRLRYTKSTPCHRVEAVPPEEFRIDRRAKSINSSLLVGRDRLVTVSELVSKGYPLEEVSNASGNYRPFYSEEISVRSEGADDSTINTNSVRYGEYYIRVDKDGDGIDELRHICTIGDNYTIVSDEPADYVKYAVFCGDPTPHSVVGSSIADLTRMFQNINTQLLRGALDSVSATLFPDTYVNENLVNMEDQLNDEVGKVVRVKGDPNAAVYEHVSPFIGAQAFEMMDTVNMLRQRRTGISEASKGIDPKALQSTSVVGVDAIVSGAQERIELIARIFAETGFKNMFKGLIREISDHPNIKKTVQLRGKEWLTVDHSLFDPNVRVSVNPTLARGNDFARLNALKEVQQTQLQIISQFGPGNQVVTPKEYMNTVEDMLAIVNIRNVGRYFRPITDDLIKQLQEAPKEPSPEELIARAEMEKNKVQISKAIADMKLKDQQMALDEDFRRDKLGLDTMVGLITALQKGAGNVGEARTIVNEGNTRDA